MIKFIIAIEMIISIMGVGFIAFFPIFITAAIFPLALSNILWIILFPIAFIFSLAWFIAFYNSKFLNKYINWLSNKNSELDGEGI